MPMLPPRNCSQWPCPHPAVYRGRCEAHSKAANRQRWSDNDGAYNGAWRRLRILVKAEEPLCRECLKLGLVEATTEIDHILPVRTHPELRLVRSNLAGLCSRHHSEKTARENGFGGGLANPGTPAGNEGPE